jgi:hypothetical protein
MAAITPWTGDALWLPEDLAWARLAKLAQRMNDARFNAAVGDETRSLIEHALPEVGLSMADRWLLATTARHERDGGVIDGRLIVPAHLVLLRAV